MWTPLYQCKNTEVLASRLPKYEEHPRRSKVMDTVAGAARITLGAPVANHSMHRQDLRSHQPHMHMHQFLKHQPEWTCLSWSL